MIETLKKSLKYMESIVKIKTKECKEECNFYPQYYEHLSCINSKERIETDRIAFDKFFVRYKDLFDKTNRSGYVVQYRFEYNEAVGDYCKIDKCFTAAEFAKQLSEKYNEHDTVEIHMSDVCLNMNEEEIQTYKIQYFKKYLLLGQLLMIHDDIQQTKQLIEKETENKKRLDICMKNAQEMIDKMNKKQAEIKKLRNKLCNHNTIINVLKYNIRMTGEPLCPTLLFYDKQTNTFSYGDVQLPTITQEFSHYLNSLHSHMSGQLIDLDSPREEALKHLKKNILEQPQYKKNYADKILAGILFGWNLFDKQIKKRMLCPKLRKAKKI